VIEGIQRMIRVRDISPGEEGKAVIQINPAMKRQWESEIKILREAPRHAEKLRVFLKARQKEYDKATNREDIERLVPEIEMLKFVLFLVSRNESKRER
jgi:hypothetical protein